MIEIWKCINGYKGYEVSSTGNIRKVSSSGKIRLLSPYKNKNGYKGIKISKNGVRKSLSVSQLVANTFIDNDCDGWKVGHKNNKSDDNNVNNLYWINPKKKRQ